MPEPLGAAVLTRNMEGGPPERMPQPHGTMVLTSNEEEGGSL